MSLDKIIKIDWLSQRFNKDETDNECFIVYTNDDDTFKVESIPYFDLKHPHHNTLAIAWSKFITALERYEEYELEVYNKLGVVRVRAIIYPKISQSITSISLLTNL